MARQARQISESGYYHIMTRGINKEKIFSKEIDKKNPRNNIKKEKRS